MNSVVVVGTDIGGTFTDIFVYDLQSQCLATTKILTTHTDPSDALLSGLVGLMGDMEIEPKYIQALSHATTLATNALIERSGARVGMVTTAGFRDVVEVGYEQMYDLYDIHLDILEPLVPRSRRRPIDERVSFNGRVLTTLDVDSAKEQLLTLKAEGVESIAVCFLHSYANPTNEQAMKLLASEIAPELPISLSSEVLPEIGELGRFSTTLVNAYVQPITQTYLNKMKSRLNSAEIKSNFTVISSRGKSITLDTAIRFPVRLLESGPAAGAYSASQFARKLDEKNLLSFDMGGTSAKVCLIRNFEAETTVEFEAARIARFKKKSGLPIRIPVVDLIEIGAGGGSIARIDSLGLPTVGPTSAGSEPGPICYSRGGESVTVTDADLVLGFLNSDYFLGGKLPLNRTNAVLSLDKQIARALNMNVDDAAWSIFSMVNDQMARAAAVHASEIGVDLRRFTLFAFGGAGPVHAAYVAKSLGIKKIIIPPHPGVLSAIGTAMSPPSFDLARSYKSELSKVDFDVVNNIFIDLLKKGDSFLDEAGVSGETSLRRSVDMRYLNQRYEVQVQLPNKRIYSELDIKTIEEYFFEAYRNKYGRLIEGVNVEVVTWRLEVTGQGSFEIFSDSEGGKIRDKQVIPDGFRDAYFGDIGKTEIPYFRRDGLPVGFSSTGPLVIEEPGSTSLVPPGGRVLVDDERCLVIHI